VLSKRFILSTALGIVAFAACNVYDPSLLTGGDDGASTGGFNTGGSSGSGGSNVAGLGGATTSGGAGGTAGSSPSDGGAGGDDAPTGGTTTGGASGTSAGGRAGAPGGGAGATSGGTAGAAGGGGGGTGGSGGLGGAGASGMGGAGEAGSAGVGGAAGAGGSGGKGGGGSGGSGGPIMQLLGTATADSEQTNPSHPASHGNDGLTATRWCAANGNTGHYWTLDLAAVHPLARFEVIWEYPASAVGLPYRYVVSVSNDGTTFTSAIDRSTTTNTMQIQTNDFPSGTNGRYVRVTVVSLPTGAWASFFEARVFGQ
jgi:hypothetical protein